jgi:hypothetical protein
MHYIVLVHGAFVDGSGWECVYKIEFKASQLSTSRNPMLWQLSLNRPPAK